MPRIYPEDGSPLTLYRGCSSLSFDAYSTGIEKSDMVHQSGNPRGGQNILYTLKQLESYTSMRQELGISASASFSAGVGEGSVRVNYYRQQHWTHFSFYLLVKVVVTNETQTLSHFKLTPEAIELSHNPQQFYQTFGDEFIVSQVTGGELLAIYEFLTESEKEREDLAISISASGMSFDAAADFKQAFERIATKKEVKVFMDQRGARGQLPKPSEFVEYALKFPELIANRPNEEIHRKDVIPGENQVPAEKVDPTNSVVFFQTLPYTRTENKPKDAKLPDLQEQRWFIEDLATAREKTLEKRENLTFALQNPWQFEAFDPVIVKNGVEAYDKYIVEIERSIERTMRDPFEIKKFTLQLPEIPEPKRNPPAEIPILVTLNIYAVGNVSFRGGEVGGVGLNFFQAIKAIQPYPPINGLKIECQGKFALQPFLGGPVTETGWTEGSCGVPDSNNRMLEFAARLTGDASRYYSIEYNANSIGWPGGAARPSSARDGGKVGVPNMNIFQLAIRVVRKISAALAAPPLRAIAEVREMPTRSTWITKLDGTVEELA